MITNCWELWVDGFVTAMRLRPDAWYPLRERADEEAQSKPTFLIALHGFYGGPSRFSDEEIDELDREAPGMIPICVEAILACTRPELFAGSAARYGSFISAKLPGRNDLCP